MAGPKLVWLDGFELTDPPQTLWARRYGTAASLTFTEGRDNIGRALKYQSNGTMTLTVPITGVMTVPVFGFAFKFNDLLTQDLVVMKRSGGVTAALKFVRDSASTGHLLVRAAATLAEMPIGSLVADRWYYIEFHAALTNTGMYELRIDHLPVLYSTASVDIQAAASPGVDAWEIQYNGSSGASYFALDDFYIVNAVSVTPSPFLGSIRVQGIRPLSVHSAEYTPSAGSNSDTLDDDVPDEDLSYNSSVAGTERTDLINMTEVDFDQLRSNYVGLMCTVDHKLDSAGAMNVAFINYDPNNDSQELYRSNSYTHVVYQLLHFAVDSRNTLFERQDVRAIHFGYVSS